MSEFYDSLDNYEPKYHIILDCTKEYFDSEQVEFLDIHEDIQGRDVLTFKCPACGATHQSLIFILG